MLAVFSPLIQADFNQAIVETNVEDYQFSGSQVDDVTSPTDATPILIILANVVLIPFWTLGMPLWLNLTLLGAMRLIFLFILYDKLRGIG